MGGSTEFLFGSSEASPFSYEKARTEEDSTSRADPGTLAINRVKQRQLQGTLRATGGYPKLFGPETDKLFQLNPQSQQLLQRYINQAGQPGLNPNQWYQDAKAAVDPTTQIGAAQDVMSQIVTPQLSNRYAAMGLGRSGAMGEAIGMAGAQIALPIASELQRQRFELERQRPNIDATLRQANLQRLQQGFAASDVQRQLDVANWQRKVQGTASALSMIPYVAGQDFQGTSRTFGNMTMDLFQAAIGLVSGMMGGSYSGSQNVTPAQMSGGAQMGPATPGGGGPSTPTVPQTSAPVPYNTQSYSFGSGFGAGFGGIGGVA